jgi:hypothetical protein
LRFLKICTLFSFMFLAACAANREATAPGQDYVEIDNPALTMSPNAPATIWVPRSYVESGVPRGGEVLKMGAEKVVQGIRGASTQSQTGAPEQQAASSAIQPNQTETPYHQTPGASPYSASPPVNRQTIAAVPREPFDGRMQAPLGAAQSVRNRIALLEADGRGLDQPLYENLHRSEVGGMLDPGQARMLAQSATLTDEKDKGDFANRLQQDYGVNVVIYLSAPDGVESGKDISAEVYDAMAGGLLQRFTGVITQDPAKDQSGKEVIYLPSQFTDKIRELLTLIPWYGRVTAVNGNRAYIAAGKEAGLRTGQTLKIYKSGRFMKGLGFAPGEQVGILIVQGFVGPNGSFGIIKEGQGIEATDLVAVE